MRLLSVETRWMELWFRTVLPLEGDTFLPGADNLPLAAFIDDYFAHTPAGSSIGIRLASILVTVLCALRFFRRPSRLRREERAQFLTNLNGSRIYIVRELPMLLKLTAFMAWDGLHSVQRGLGVTGSLGNPALWLSTKEG